LSQSTLKRDTLTPGMAVAGFIHFPLSDYVQAPLLVEQSKNGGVERDTVRRAMRVDFDATEHRVKITLPSGRSFGLMFKPVAAR